MKVNHKYNLKLDSVIDRLKAWDSI
jgi:hypothetical protein